MAENEERQSTDMINFALLSFLADGPKKAKNLQFLLDSYTKIELSRTPFYRRMRGLVEDGHVSEEKIDGFGTVLYSLTEKGDQFCVSWAGTVQTLVGLVFSTSKYAEQREYVSEDA